MRLLLPSIVLFSFSTAIPLLSQTTAPAGTPSTATAPKGPVDLTGFKEHIEEKNKVLSSEVNSTKAIVKKNSAILEDAKKIAADNQRLQAERKALDAQNAEFARESQAMQAEAAGNPPPAAPVRVVPVAPAPARVEPPPPARVDTAVAPRVEAPAPVRVEAPKPVRVEAAVAPVVPAPAPVAPAPAPVAPARVEATVAPAPVVAPRVEAPAPVRVETASAPRVEAIAARVVPATAPVAPVAAPVVPVPEAVIVRTPDPTVNIAAGGGSPLARTPDAATPRVAVDVPTGPLRISSGVSQGMLLSPIAPVYPAIAVTAHVEGAVVMEAVISKSGSVASVHAVSGPPMLRGAAIDAVKVAHYRPYTVNGQATEVTATIRVNFQLSR